MSLSIQLLENSVECFHSTERNWSAYDLIHCKRRSQLSHNKAQKLVFIYHNAKRRRHVRSSDFDFEMHAWEEDIISGDEH